MPCANHSTAQLIEDKNNSQAVLLTQHIVTSQSDSCVAKRNSTVMVIITLKTVLNEKVGYYFCQVILLF